MATSGTSTKELAQRLQTHRAVISRWKHGECLPSIRHAVALERLSGGLIPAAAVACSVEAHRLIPKWELVKMIRAERIAQMMGRHDEKLIDIYSAQDEAYAPVTGEEAQD